MKTILRSTIVIMTIIAAVFSLQSCDKIKDKFFPGFEAEPNDLQISIPVIASITPESNIASITTHFNMDSIIQAETLNAFTIKNVESITIQELSLNVMDADNNNHLGNFENLAVKLHSNANTNASLIASAPVITNEFTTELSLSAIASNNLRGYMNGSQLTYTITGKARRTTTRSITCMLHMRFKIN